MSATKTLEEGRDLLRFVLSSPDTGGHWTDDELTLYLDKAQKDIAIRLPDELLFSMATKNALSIASVGEVAMPSSYFRYVGSYRYLVATPNTWKQVDKVSFDDFTRLKTSLKYSSAAVSHTYLSEFANNILVHPVGASTEYLYIHYVKRPTEFVNSSSLFSVDDVVYEWVVYYGAFLACLKDSQERANTFLTHLNNQIVETSALFKIKNPPIFKIPLQVAQVK